MLRTLSAVTAVVSILVQFTRAGICQTVHIGPIDPNFCATAEHIKPNLELDRTTRVSGRVIDQSGAPFKKSRIELRKYMSEERQITAKTVLTDQNGKFDLDATKPGKYRLLASLTLASIQATGASRLSEPD